MQISDFAIIKDGKVLNIIVGNYTDVSIAAHQLYGNDVSVVEIYSMYYPPAVQIPAMIGDTYADGKFYHDGAEVQPIALPQDRINTLEQTTSAHSEAIDDLIIAITPTEAN